MILRTLLLCLALLPLNSPLQAGMWDNVTGYFKGNTRQEPPTIRVLLLHDVEGAKLEVRGKYSLFDPYTNQSEGKRFTGKSRYIQISGGDLKWGEVFPSLHQLKIRPDEPTTITLVNDRAYRDLIFIYDIGGTLSIVNQVPIEEYVDSILTAYQNQSLEPETLAALAIVLRTNAYYQAAHPKTSFWAVDAKKVGYEGFNPDSAVENDAVRLTRYMIMSHTGVYEGTATPFAAQFDALSAGQAKETEVSTISLQEANEMAKRGDHAAQILAKAFPQTTIMLMKYAH